MFNDLFDDILDNVFKSEREVADEKAVVESNDTWDTGREAAFWKNSAKPDEIWKNN